MVYVAGPGTGSPPLEQEMNALEKQFRGETNKESPAKFHCENQIELQLKRLLKESHNKELTAIGGYLKNSITQNRKQYVESLCALAVIDRVQTQLNIGLSSHFQNAGIDEETKHEKLLTQLMNYPPTGDFTMPGSVAERKDTDNSLAEDYYEKIIGEYEDGKTKRRNSMLDLAILGQGCHPVNEDTELGDHSSIPDGDDYPDEVVEFCVANGAQFWPPEAIDTAIELKYFKTSTTPNGRTGKQILKDIINLSLLTGSSSNEIDAEAHLVVVSNMNLFRRGSEDPKDGASKTKEYRQKYADIGEVCEANGIHFWYIHPPA